MISSRHKLSMLAVALVAASGVVTGCRASGPQIVESESDKIERAVSEIEQMRVMVEKYRWRFGRSHASFERIRDEMKDGFPDVDPWGRPYEYRGSQGGYVLFSLGADPNSDGDDIYFDTNVGHLVAPGRPLRD
jgi:hypothetical protein